jgi:hypothetical protein
MAFNTFHKNRRFWMAAVLMICMISFVFCTGSGDMAEKITRWTGNRGGPTIASIDGRSISRRDLDELRTQRNLANTFMKHCADISYKNVSERFFELKKPGTEKDDPEKRAQSLTQLQAIRSTLGIRKSKSRYFDIGVKFDDLLEFKLWQAEADRLGIRIDDEHLNYLFGAEFFGAIKGQELFLAQREAQRESRDATDAVFRRAIAEEFRVRIAQYASLMAQPYSHLYRRKQGGEGFTHKFIDPTVPDETRAPMTLAQVWDFYKAQRAEFSVSLLPVEVEDFVKGKLPFAKKISEPDDIQKAEHFNANKNEPLDPSSDKVGLEIPPQAKFEFVIADPKSPPYRDLAKTVTLLKLISPVAFDAVESPLAAVTRYMASSLKYQEELEFYFNSELSKAGRNYRAAALNSERDVVAPILLHYAGRHPQAVASLIGSAAFAPEIGVAGYMEWGTKKYPLEGTVEEKDGKKFLNKLVPNEAELYVAIHSEVKRRAAFYGQLAGAGLTGFPLDVVFPYLALDPMGAIGDSERFSKGAALSLPIHQIPAGLYTQFKLHPHFTAATVQQQLEEIRVSRLAEEWAQENILIVKTALEQAAGDGEKFRRELNKYVPQLNLTYGPEHKDEFYSRYTIDKAEEFAPLKESYLKYIHMINLFEGRDVPPKQTLKPSDFNKLFFDPTEPFSATGGKYRAMPWPPEVKAENTRELQLINPGLKKEVAPEDLERFDKYVKEHDPKQGPKVLKLYETAERPILFWRTVEINANRPADYKKVITDLQQFGVKKAKLEEELKKNPSNALAREQVAVLKKEQADLQLILDRVTEGWKFERARKDEALPYAKTVAQKLVDAPVAKKLSTMLEEASKLKKDIIPLAQLSQMHQEEIGGNRVDYFPPPLPKDRIKPEEYPREDMMQQVLSLYNLQSPIKVGNPELDEVNKDLFEAAKKDAEGQKPDRFVQIIANKPRSIFYIAAITTPPTPDLLPFKFAMEGAAYPELAQQVAQMRFQQGMKRDLFVDRAQEQEARVYRAEFIRGLGQAHDFKIVDTDAKKTFDGGGD